MLRRLLPLSLAGVLLACGGASDPAAVDVGAAPTVPPTAAATESSAVAPPSTSGAAVTDAPEALQFSAPLVGGGQIELASLAGRPVLLWFWAPW